jgi:hypothetical protein
MPGDDANRVDVADPVPKQERSLQAEGAASRHQELLPCEHLVLIYLSICRIFEMGENHHLQSSRSADLLTCTFYLQDFDGASGDHKAGREYFKKRFGRLAQKAGRSKEREVYIHTTTATDTQMLKMVMSAVEE